MASFAENYKKVHASEDDYHDGVIGTKVDPGGETYRGIARRFHPNWDGWKVIDAIKKRRQINDGDEIPEVNTSAYNYSKKTFWDAYNLDDINSQWVANIMFEIVWGFPSKATELKTNLGIKSTIAWKDVTRLINKMNASGVYAKYRALYAKLLRNSSSYPKFKKGYEARIASWPENIPNLINRLFPVDPLAGPDHTDVNIINLYIFITSLFLF